jgi:hypothetical protein
MELIRLKDFKDIQLYITDDEYRNNNPFAEQIKLKAKALKLAQLQDQPKKRRIRKTTEERPNKKQYRCGHCKELGHNRKGCRNGRKEPEVVVISSSEASEEEASKEEASAEDKDELA